MNKDYFAGIAEDYEQNADRVDNVTNIADRIVQRVPLEKSMHVLDFGSGTGLLLERLAPFVGKITAVDISESMNRQLVKKRDRLACELEIRSIDLAKHDLTERYDGIVSSMTLHHIQDIDSMFRRFFGLVRKGGFIAIADLDSEDGSFHAEDTGVHHLGFDRRYIASAAERAGFRGVLVESASVIEKPHGSFPIFLLTGSRP